jgi:hypothetical protein
MCSVRQDFAAGALDECPFDDVSEFADEITPEHHQIVRTGYR